jgi:hypothetical protein
MCQIKNKAHCQFFKNSSDAVENVAPVIEMMAKQDTPLFKEMLAEYRVNPMDYTKEQHEDQEKPQHEPSQT